MLAYSPTGLPNPRIELNKTMVYTYYTELPSGRLLAGPTLVGLALLMQEAELKGKKYLK